MATYLELYELSSNLTLISKVTAAIAVAAETIRTEQTDVPDHAKRLVWANRALQNPDGEARKIMWSLLAQYSTFTVVDLTNASDASIQTAVNSSISLFI